jgi:BirA family biotin operon repressor/biotin-[acetyl-CoA-carboxylase] ligase
MNPVLTPPIDANVVWFSEIDSTNAAAARLVAGWAEDEDDRLRDTVIVAETQAAGRGRNAHAWESPAGGLYATWLGWLPSSALAWLPIAAGVCLAEAVAELVPEAPVALKWPNDLVVGGRKLGGLLCQSRTRGDWAWAAVGLGVNVAVAPRLPDGRTAEATALASLGLTATVESALWALVGGFVRRLRPALDDPAGVRSSWLQMTVHRHSDPLRIRTGDEVVVGGFVGLSDDGQLELKVDGSTRRFAAGELITALTEPEG